MENINNINGKGVLIICMDRCTFVLLQLGNKTDCFIVEYEGKYQTNVNMHLFRNVPYGHCKLKCSFI